MRVLVTGGAGFVGRAFVTRFLARGDHVVVVDDLSSGKDPTEHGRLVFMRADCRDYFKHTAFCDFDLVVHLAAVVGGRLKIEGDPLAVATDLSIDSDFFNWISKVPSKAHKVIYFSSSAVYPLGYQAVRRHALVEPMVTFDVGDIGMPDMTYGWSKLSGEYLAKFAAEKYDVPVVIYRPFSGYGRTQSLDYPFPSIIKRVISGESPITVWGSGKQSRDFIYIDDVVDAVLATLHKLAPGETLNLGSGVDTSFTELAQRAAALFNRPLEVVNDPTKPEGVFCRVANVDKLNRFYTPKITLDEGIIRVGEYLTSTMA